MKKISSLEAIRIYREAYPGLLQSIQMENFAAVVYGLMKSSASQMFVGVLVTLLLINNFTSRVIDFEHRISSQEDLKTLGSRLVYPNFSGTLFSY